MLRTFLTLIVLTLLFGTAWSAGNKAMTQEEIFSYAIGYQLAQSTLRQGYELKTTLAALGLTDALNGSLPRASPEAMQQAMEAYLVKMAAKRTAKAARKLTTSKQFMAKNIKKPGIISTASGLQYRVISKGFGPKPTAADRVKVNYRGTLIDGSEFDSSYKHGQPAIFQVGKIIKGWQEALQLMPAGANWRVYVPPHLGYGKGGAGSKIGPNEVLIFDIELIAVL